MTDHLREIRNPTTPDGDAGSNPTLENAKTAGAARHPREVKPIGSIHTPSIGRNPRIPPAVSSNPAGILSQRPDGWRTARTAARRRFGSRSMSASRRQSSPDIRRVQISRCVGGCLRKASFLLSRSGIFVQFFLTDLVALDDIDVSVSHGASRVPATQGWLRPARCSWMDNDPVRPFRAQIVTTHDTALHRGGRARRELRTASSGTGECRP